MSSSATARPPFRIAVVCLGNICRSPMADVVLSSQLANAGLSDTVTVESFGTGGWHQGNPMDRRAASTLRSAGYDGSAHRARQFTSTQSDQFDLLLAMDADNLADLKRLNSQAPVETRLFRDFDPVNSGADVPDPYYGGVDGFEEVLEMVERTATAIVARCADGTLGRPR